MIDNIFTKGQKFLKNNWKKCTFAILVIALLTFLFWYGGDGENSRGWKVDKENTKEMEVLSTEGSTQNKSTSGNDTSTTGANTEQAQETTKVDLTETNPEQQSVSQQLENNTNQYLNEQNVPDENDNIQNDGDQQDHNVPSETISATSGQSQKATCTISISCKNILNNMSKLKSNKKELIPSDGWILKTVSVEISEGDTVFDILQRVTHERVIHMEASFTPLYNSYYIEGINNIYEFDCGSLSGWVYLVNDQTKNISSSEIKVNNGDSIRWVYTCDLGKDVQ